MEHIGSVHFGWPWGYVNIEVMGSKRDPSHWIFQWKCSMVSLRIVTGKPRVWIRVPSVAGWRSGRSSWDSLMEVISYMLLEVLANELGVINGTTMGFKPP